MKFFYSAILLTALLPLSAFSQDGNFSMQYEPSPTHPYGQLNPEASSQLADFAPLIGTCDCRNVSRNGDGTWQDTINMVWRYKYIMNGTAVQDEVWRENGAYASSIRQFQPDSAVWVVTYFSYPKVSTAPGVWLGGKIGDEIILRKPQTAPNGMEGKYKITFYEMSEEGFKWKGEWMDTAETFSYPTLYNECEKRKE